MKKILEIDRCNDCRHCIDLGRQVYECGKLHIAVNWKELHPYCPLPDKDPNLLDSFTKEAELIKDTEKRVAKEIMEMVNSHNFRTHSPKFRLMDKIEEKYGAEDE